jgi:nicotinate-nucleotide adenylyltransferase
MRVALFGGSFDPPHAGHVLAAAYLTAVAGFDRVLVVPVFSHAFAKKLTDFGRRVEMCQLAFARLLDVEVCTIESELAPNHTLATVNALSQRFPEWAFHIVVGADVLPELVRWHAIDELLALAPLYVLGRSGIDAKSAPTPLLPEVSSTQIRTWCGAPLTPEREETLRLLLPPPVLEVIRRWGLYQSA